MEEADCQSNSLIYDDIPSDWDGDTQCDVKDSDDDNDGISDSVDACPLSSMAVSQDWDGDGCKDIEDSDDDNDGVEDLSDDCQTGDSGWNSDSSSDYDSDGCKDSTEDDDDDNDGVMDFNDDCSLGSLSWISSSLTDWDGDGCNDSSEDDDDDNDQMMDIYDSCPTGIIGWHSETLSDWDNDGCQDSSEDMDDDNDGIDDSEDLCTPFYETGWISTLSEDWDGDGCRDSTEDSDDDNDGMYDWADDCPTGDTGWISTVDTDFDQDGCQDDGEDTDDDNDGYSDSSDWYDRGNGVIFIDVTAWSADSNDCDYDSSCGSPDPYFIINVDWDCDYNDDFTYNQFDDDGTYWSNVRSLYDSNGLVGIYLDIHETLTEICFTIGVMDYDSSWLDDDDVMDYAVGSYSWYIFSMQLNTTVDETETYSAIGPGEGNQCSITWRFYATDDSNLP